MKRIHLILFLILSLALWTACESDLNEDPGNPGNPGNPNSGKTLSADEASEHLVLKDQSKITGTLPAANDGQLKLDVQDTIFVVKGYPLGSRIEVLHHPGENVAGYNLYLPGSSFYYHVPETIIEGQYQTSEENDTTSIMELDFDPPVDEVDYPYTIEVVIQPVDDGGNPLDEFERWVTVEDPEDASGSGCNSIIRPESGPPYQPVWIWDFTVREFNGDIVNVFAPGLATPINSQGGGCCSGNGNSYYAGEIPACVVNTNAQNMSWVEVEPDDYYVRTFEIMWFWANGEVVVFSNEVIKNWNLFTTNFCSGNLAYTWQNNDYNNSGTHDFTPSASQINLDFPNWDGSWKPPARADIIYTCHTLMMSFGAEDKFTAVYKTIDSNEDFAFYDVWKPWFD